MKACWFPTSAVGTEQARKFLLIVGPDNVVAQKYVTIGQVTSDGLRAIKEGLGPNDRVVVNGLMRARAGQKVTPQEQGAAPPPAPAAAAPKK